MARFDFNADEIFEMAERIERNGAAFYRKAASFASCAASKELLTELASWEEKHEALFKELHGELTTSERTAQVFDPNDECARYLQSFADRHVFDTAIAPADRLTGDEELEELLRVAIGLEKDSIVFYLGLKDATATTAGKSKVEEIIREEMRHVSILSDELRKALAC